MPETAAPASSVCSKAASSVRTASGTRQDAERHLRDDPERPLRADERRRADRARCVARRRRARRARRPAARPRRPSTWLTVKPYFRQCAPPEFSATLPPIVHTCCDSTDPARSSSRRRDRPRVTSRFVTPARRRLAAVEVDLEDAVHARERDHDALGDRQRAAREAGAGAARDERDARVVAEPDDGLHLGRRRREGDERGNRRGGRSARRTRRSAAARARG